MHHPVDLTALFVASAAKRHVGKRLIEVFFKDLPYFLPPGVYTTEPFVHEYWEEVFLVSGDLVCGSDAQGKGGESFTGPTYCVRPPGVHHGPFTSKNGCLLLETHYYVPK